MRFCDIDEIKKAGSLLAQGEVVAFPTETVYGLGVRFDEEAAYRKLVAVKRRPPEKPFSVMCFSLEQALRLADASSNAKRVMERFMPGEITVLVKASPTAPFQATLGSGVIGLRVPASNLAIAVLAACGAPCLVSSANHSGEPVAKSAAKIEKIFGSEIAMVVHGECVSQTPSTIVDMSENGKIRLIRQGAISFDDIKSVFDER